MKQKRQARRLRLVDVSRRLGVPYQRVWMAVAAGVVPAERDPGGTRWLVDARDLPRITRILRTWPMRPAIAE